MIIRTINLLAAIAALWLLGEVIAPALFLKGGTLRMLIAFSLYGACGFWIIRAYHSITLKWHQGMVARGGRRH